MSEGSGAPASSESRLGAIALVALLVASLAVGIYVYRSRTPDLALEVTSFNRELRDGRADIEFFVRFDEPEATIEIVGRDQVVARTLSDSFSLVDGQRINCIWDGETDEGEKAEPGKYRLRVTLPDQDRVMVFPRRVDVEPGAQSEEAFVGSGEVCGVSAEQ